MKAAPPASSAALSDLAPTGRLRAGINYGNAILAARDPGSGELRGPWIAAGYHELDTESDKWSEDGWGRVVFIASDRRDAHRLLQGTRRGLAVVALGRARGNRGAGGFPVLGARLGHQRRCAARGWRDCAIIVLMRNEATR